MKQGVDSNDKNREDEEEQLTELTWKKGSMEKGVRFIFATFFKFGNDF